MNRCTIAILITNSVFCAIGILLILISCIQFDNYWPLLTIAVHALAVLFPVICGGCHVNREISYLEEKECALISWLFVGIFTIAGYAIPSILLRAGLIPQIGLFLTFGGGTIILMCILIFVRAVYFAKVQGEAYVF